MKSKKTTMRLENRIYASITTLYRSPEGSSGGSRSARSESSEDPLTCEHHAVTQSNRTTQGTGSTAAPLSTCLHENNTATPALATAGDKQCPPNCNCGIGDFESCNFSQK